MVAESIHDPYITYGPLRRYCTCILYLFDARGQSSTSHKRQRTFHDPNIRGISLSRKVTRVTHGNLAFFDRHLGYVN